MPALVCLHHPPVAVGIPALDSIRLADAAALQDVLSRHRPPALILAGHVHRTITARFADTVVSVAPSTHRQVELNLRADRPTGYVAEPTSILLHLLTKAGCVKHALPVGHTSAAFATV